VTKAGDLAEQALRLRYAILGAELLEVGIDADCAPVGDLITDRTHPFLRNRCYGSDPATVARLGRAVADGLLSAGVMPVMKHLPGHGRSEVDTHHDLPTVTASRPEVIAHDFAPFKAWADLPMAMTAHLVFTAWDADRPATQSPAMIQAIRHDIGFDGLLMTDDLNMQALKGDLASRTRASMDAGCDIALHCKGDLGEMQAVAAEAGQLTPAARLRAQRVLAHRPKATVDIRQAERDLCAIMPDAFHGPN
jgi:beta-N-acetylhexosaminidase